MGCRLPAYSSALGACGCLACSGFYVVGDAADEARIRFPARCFLLRVSNATQRASKVAIRDTFVEGLTFDRTCFLAAALKLPNDVTILGVVGQDAIQDAIGIPCTLGCTGAIARFLNIGHAVEQVRDAHLFVAVIAPDEGIWIRAFAFLTLARGAFTVTAAVLVGWGGRTEGLTHMLVGVWVVAVDANVVAGLNGDMICLVVGIHQLPIEIPHGADLRPVLAADLIRSVEADVGQTLAATVRSIQLHPDRRTDSVHMRDHADDFGTSRRAWFRNRDGLAFTQGDGESLVCPGFKEDSSAWYFPFWKGPEVNLSLVRIVCKCVR